MLALLSPPEDSDRMPGMLRKISAVDRAPKLSIWSMFNELVDTLVSNRVPWIGTAVTTTSSSSMPRAADPACSSA